MRRFGRPALAAGLLAASLTAGCGGTPFEPFAPHASSASAARAGTPSAIFLDHGFMVNRQHDAAIAQVVRWLAERHFTYQFHNVGALRADGTLDAAGYSQLKHWIAVSRQTDPQQKIVVYLSGSLRLVNDRTAWPKIARLCATFVSAYGADGVNLDFEPYRAQAAPYEGLFGTIRKAVGPRADLSLDYTADAKYFWKPGDFERIASYFQWIAPMLYDTECRTAACYRGVVDTAAAYQSKYLPAGTQLMPLFPTYAKSRYHDPSVETICAAATEIASLARAGRASAGAQGVWWYFGWNANAQRQWSRCGSKIA